MTSPIMDGAEPFSAAGGPAGVLVVHGFTGNPQSMRPLAEALARAGFTVELPLLPGHGTALDDMLPTRWPDWLGAAEAAYDELAARCPRVVVAGLSMGGTLATTLAATRPATAGLVAVNPAVDPPAPSFRDMLRELLAAGTTVMPAIGSDIAKEGVVEAAYPGTPVEALLSLCEGEDALVAQLAEVRCPVLLFTSRQDHVVPPVSSDVLADRVSGPVERVWLERSFHVATLDHDREEIEARTVEFARKVTAA